MLKTKDTLLKHEEAEVQKIRSLRTVRTHFTAAEGTKDVLERQAEKGMEAKEQAAWRRLSNRKRDRILDKALRRNRYRMSAGRKAQDIPWHPGSRFLTQQTYKDICESRSDRNRDTENGSSGDNKAHMDVAGYGGTAGNSLNTGKSDQMIGSGSNAREIRLLGTGMDGINKGSDSRSAAEKGIKSASRAIRKGAAMVRRQAGGGAAGERQTGEPKIQGTFKMVHGATAVVTAPVNKGIAVWFSLGGSAFMAVLAVNLLPLFLVFMLVTAIIAPFGGWIGEAAYRIHGGYTIDQFEIGDYDLEWIGTGTVDENGIPYVPYINQGAGLLTESGWAYTDWPYYAWNRDENIRNSGCGYCSTAMALSYLMGQLIAPVDFMYNGTFVDGYGADHALGIAAAKSYGIPAKGTRNWSEAYAALLAGHPVMVIEGYGYWTKGNGHYILLIGVLPDGTIAVNDPGSRDRTYWTNGNRGHSQFSITDGAKYSAWPVYTIFG